MKVIKDFLVGSSYFFQSYPDYVIKDRDWIVLVDVIDKPKRLVIGEDDMFIYPIIVDREEFLNNISVDTIKVGKFLVPDFCEYIGFNIDDLKSLYKCFDNLDDKHKYLKVIFDAYIENNSFNLTDKQRDDAYSVYKQARELNNKNATNLN